MKLFCGTSNQPLAQKVADYLNIPLGKANVSRFNDGEVFVEIQESVRGEDIFILQSTSAPTNDNLLELLLMIDAFRRSSAKRITAVVPYFGYARQDRKTAARTPISAKLVSNLIVQSGAQRLLTLDLHAGQIQGFFDVPVDNLFAVPIIAEDIKKTLEQENIMVISPDVGGVVRARALAKRLACRLAIVDKRRETPGSSEVMNIIGDVKNMHCIMLDDIIDSGGTLCNAAKALIDHGAKSAKAYITHGVLSGEALHKVQNSALSELIITDSINPRSQTLATPNVRILSISALIGEAIARTATERSVSCLFD